MGNFDVAQIGAAGGYEFDGVGAKFAESGDGFGESGEAAGGSERRGGGVFAAAVGAVAEEAFFAAVAVGEESGAERCVMAVNMPRSAETTCSAHSRMDQRSDDGFSRA